MFVPSRPIFLWAFANIDININFEFLGLKCTMHTDPSHVTFTLNARWVKVFDSHLQQCPPHSAIFCGILQGRHTRLSSLITCSFLCCNVAKRRNLLTFEFSLIFFFFGDTQDSFSLFSLSSSKSNIIYFLDVILFDSHFSSFVFHNIIN